MFILDSSAIIEILKGSNCGKEIGNELDKTSLATTVFSVYEILVGAKPQEIEKIESFFKDLDIISFDKLAARETSLIEKELTAKGSMINKIDIFIASLCRLNDAILVTADKDFKKISNFKLKFIS